MINGSRKSYQAAGALEPFRCVKLSSGQVTYAGVTDEDIGVTELRTFNAGEPQTVRLRTAGGTVEVCLSGNITEGAEVFAAANGKVASAGSVSRGWAQKAGADGDIIEIIRR